MALKWSRAEFRQAKTKEFYWILNERNPTPLPTGPEKWKKTVTELNEWQTFFKSARNIFKENKLKEFQFKFLHRIVVTKKELFRFGIKQDSDCLFCGGEDSIDHTFINCQSHSRLGKVYLGGSTLRIIPTYFLH